MRRLAVVFFACAALGSCATPKIGLQARFVRDEVRAYRLVADANVRISTQQGTNTERTRLDATAQITVVDVSAGVATLELRITPRSLTRDGRSAGLPPEQVVQLKVAPDGGVSDVTTVGSTPVQLEATDIEDLVPLIGPPLPPRRVHLTDRWRRTPTGPDGVPAGTQEARLSALRIVSDFDCAIVEVQSRRPVVRQRQVNGAPLRLEGVEFAAGEIAFAFREGLPVTVRSDAEARLAISGTAAAGGEVVIRTVTSLTLQRRTVPASG